MIARGDPRRAIPGVDRLLARPWCELLIATWGRVWIADRVRAVLNGVRSGEIPLPDAVDDYEQLVEMEVARAGTLSLRGVVNATGVILHTNLGRARLADEASRAMSSAAGYVNVEFDLETGERGSRYTHCAGLVTELLGAEDALVVNNGAAAVAVALAAHAAGRGVAVSHGELVEIGGGFRIPEVVEAAGARLVTVGTTNRTRLDDYARAVAAGGVGAILKVHRSNFSMSGFTEETSLTELVRLGAESGVPVIHDLGSGLMVDSDRLGLPYEPTPAMSVAAGVDLVAFSGDKLLGGPQAGILAGKKAGVAQARAHPLCRALRCDKVTLAGLEATLTLYRDPDRAMERVPVLKMITARVQDLERNARSVARTVTRLRAERGAEPLRLEAVRGQSLVGGGTFPDARLPTAVLTLEAGAATDRWMAALRTNVPPIVARSRQGRILFDFRTLRTGGDSILAAALLHLDVDTRGGE
ncbi:MAG: L-seryl-tRNA(Sec) selenium transferase [Gemmatimonadetes bacterium]|nr:L-seryl-tRNA(Sec) selenium transferase [Gemmatimonadota bacterium]MCY3612937.1 L-seryl-tRNA(Sec) selenium transferase [Gemmatimonadota bacterium]MCY3678206.1 L-seryl-tRNA(Sec) selenium transferase [Gemmatimonadota bacterium]MYA41201.1 L-seryl-tRNA(Sec) selenium transferase [Gemmatimonadota bacterium]MYE93641.1 L-seryl-tRNA(Sec) selenium transferase [Gemmatimonadota bacterium]